MADNTLKFRAVMDDKVSGPLDRIRGKFDTFGKSTGFKSVAQGFGIGAGIGAWGLLSNAISSATDFISNSTQAASDLNEQVSKSGVVFGESAKGIDQWSSTTAKSFGISKRAALEAAGTFGQFFTGAGQGADKAAEMSQKLVELGADLASFNNIDPTDVLDKLRSGLAGEAEPLRAVGVFLTEAKVKAKGMQLGLADAHGELTEGEKILARYQIILDETSKAQGDFARTSTGLANSKRIEAAVVEDYQALLGQKFLPIAKQVTIWQIGALQGAEKLAGGIGDLAANFNDLIGGIGDGLQPWNRHQEAINENVRAVENYNKSAQGMQEEQRESNRIMGLSKKPVDELAKATDGATKKVDTFASQTNKATDKVVDYFGDMKEASLDALSGMISGFFDPIESRFDILSAHRDLEAAKDGLRHAKTKTAIHDATNEIVKNLGKQGDALEDLAKTGDLTKDDVLKFKKDVTGAYKAMGKQIPADLQAIINKLELIAGVNINIKATVHAGVQGHAAGKKRAKGGPVDPWEAYTVGEEGPETLVMGRNGGTIVPNGASRDSGSTTRIIQLVVSGKVLAQVVDEENGWAMDRASPTRGRF